MYAFAQLHSDTSFKFLETIQIHLNVLIHSMHTSPCACLVSVVRTQAGVPPFPRLLFSGHLLPYRIPNESN